MQRSVLKYRTLVWGIVEPISLRNWSGNLIKRDKSFHILLRLKILGVIGSPQCLKSMLLMSGSQPNSGKAKFNAGNKGNYFFLNGKFWLIPVSLANHRLIGTSPSLLWRLQGRRASGKEKWSSNCGFVITAQLRSSKLSSCRGPCDQPSSPTPTLTSPLSIHWINPQWRGWASGGPMPYATSPCMPLPLERRSMKKHSSYLSAEMTPNL